MFKKKKINNIHDYSLLGPKEIEVPTKLQNK